MKYLLCSLVILSAGLLASSPASAGFGTPTLGNQYISMEPSNTTTVAPVFLYPGSGLLTQSGSTTVTQAGVTEAVTNGSIAILSFSNNYATGGLFNVASVAPNSANYALQLAGNPPRNSYGATLTNNEFQYSSNSPTTYYTLVTEGSMKGTFFTVVSNTTHSVTIDAEGLAITSKDIKAINILPYWSLSSLFPSSQATISFIPTTNSSNIMTTIVISPPSTTGTNQPQQVGQSYYFNATLTNWVNETNPSLPAGDDVIAPGQYVYVQNNGSNCYPLYEFISGSVLPNDFNFYFSTSSRNVVISYFSLPRNSIYGINQIGFNDQNFTQSPTKSSLGRKDQLIIDNGHGGIAATYYKYKNQWYDASSDQLSTNPVFAAGTVFGVVKSPTPKGTSVLINKYNVPTPSAASASSAFKSLPVPVTPNGGNPSPTTNGGS
jgi:uncharacterized protein (TIGR02597 family)